MLKLVVLGFFAVLLAGCGESSPSEGSLPEPALSAVAETTPALSYECGATGTDAAMGPPIWFGLDGDVATLSRSAAFHHASTGHLDAHYHPKARDTERYLGFRGWVADSKTVLTIDKGLEVANGAGLILVNTTAGSTHTITRYSCSYLGAAPDAGPACASSGFAGALATFDFAGLPGTELSVAPSSTAPGVVGGELSRSSALVDESGAGSINSKEWSTGTTADPTRHYTLTITPPTNCAMSLSTLTLTSSSSSTGPKAIDVATSVDGFATYSSLTFTGAQPLSGTSRAPVEIRVYGYQATSADGTYRLEDALTVSGSLE
jgi:hypothetical protein